MTRLRSSDAHQAKLVSLIPHKASLEDLFIRKAKGVQSGDRGSCMKVISIALNTFRENLRDKLLYNLLIFALLMIGSSLILMRLTLGEFHRLILDIGLGQHQLLRSIDRHLRRYRSRQQGN